ncbi:alpha/beta fold hydrolase [Paracoccus cavernae]|uniref:alpha/beta fold hydrolase n=1 Tax=Paracoccus cavernae TaxID=1571207 RepID=UPI0036448E29
MLLFQGRAEYLEKYNGVAQALNEAGYDVLSLDWRGQGLSDRLIDNPHLSHIADFADYQRDVLELVVAAGELSLPRPWHLLAHSMGGAIGYASLLDELPVVSAVFSSPMWGINTTPYPLWSIAAGPSSAAGSEAAAGIAPARAATSRWCCITLSPKTI